MSCTSNRWQHLSTTTCNFHEIGSGPTLPVAQLSQASPNISNLSEYFCIICKFEYFARYVIFQIIYIYIYIYILKHSIGPNTDPCGTPLKTDF